jgi:hypothetical protein
MAKGDIRKAMAVGLIVGTSFFLLTSVAPKATLASIHSQTAHDYWNQSITAYNHNDTMQSCVLMGIAKAAALSAHDDAYYEKTLKEERSICAEAGLTR